MEIDSSQGADTIVRVRVEVDDSLVPSWTREHVRRWVEDQTREFTRALTSYVLGLGNEPKEKNK